MTTHERELAIRQAIKNARRSRRAAWKAIPLTARMDPEESEILNSLDWAIDQLFGVLERIKWDSESPYASPGGEPWS
jgi:hypothetical protein